MSLPLGWLHPVLIYGPFPILPEPSSESPHPWLAVSPVTTHHLPESHPAPLSLLATVLFCCHRGDKEEARPCALLSVDWMPGDRPGHAL